MPIRLTLPKMATGKGQSCSLLPPQHRMNASLTCVTSAPSSLLCFPTAALRQEIHGFSLTDHLASLYLANSQHGMTPSCSSIKVVHRASSLALLEMHLGSQGNEAVRPLDFFTWLSRDCMYADPLSWEHTHLLYC